MNKAIAAAITMMAAGAVSVSAMSGAVSAAEDCLSETYSWNNPTVSQLATWQPTLSTGLSIPAPAAGEHIAVIATGWSSFDRLMEENPELTREIQNEIAEQFSVRVGGVQVGGLSADLPDMSGFDLLDMLSPHVLQADVDPMLSGSRISLDRMGEGLRAGIFIVSDAYLLADEQRALASGVAGYLVRPVTLDVIRSACRPARNLEASSAAVDRA
jgi:hypothetical protein